MSADDIVCLNKLPKAILEQGSQQNIDKDLVELIGELDKVDISTPNESALLYITKCSGTYFKTRCHPFASCI